MIQKIGLENAEFVESFDEYGFNEIVSDFDDAKRILIVTYNLSSNSLLQRLAELPKDIDICVFAYHCYALNTVKHLFFDL